MTISLKADAGGTFGTLQVGGVDKMSFGSDTSGQPFAFRNVLINGGMRVAQRGNITFTGTNDLYGGADRWLGSISGTTVSAILLRVTNTNAISGYVQQIGNLTTTGATTAVLSQRIEALNTIPLNGKTVTVSGKVYQSSASAQTLTIGINKPVGVDNWSSQTSVGYTSLSIPNNTWTPFTYTLTLGSTDASNGLSLFLAYNSLVAQTNSQFYFADMQLEAGSIATAFEQRSVGIEVALCQRYYETNSAAVWHANIHAAFGFMVSKRTIPTLTTNPTGGSYLSGPTVNSLGFTGLYGAVSGFQWTASAEL